MKADYHTLKSCIIVFLKYPETGRVKTRLCKSVDAKNVIELYKRMVKDILTTLNKCSYEKYIFFDPPDYEIKVKEWIGSEYIYFPQKGDDLGIRMFHAFQQVFSNGYEQAVLIGTDSPDLPEYLIYNAFMGLQFNDAVIGPSMDGGYYLIGFNKQKLTLDVFEKMLWGTKDVFQMTFEKFQKKMFNVHILAHWQDIDEYEDLKNYLKNYSVSLGTGFETFSYALTIRNLK